ncbi:hypothetical protein [Amphibacillus cookii]|uniref:hypothetical protein n=1 Tax=Amphibacillus cookii TaxID=767787 RepID=UPI00195B5C88|nr:hypothetical protein [Amphibacillus cookii]MBM7541998.1 hypothetical protein [Amphibacillus cookii]
MKRLNYALLFVFLNLFLFGCQQHELFDQEITSIDILTWDDQEQVGKLTDPDFIAELADHLETAESASTANLDIPNPDYLLRFNHQEETIQQIGYYNEEKTFNQVTGQFINIESSELYNVSIDLAIDD